MYGNDDILSELLATQDSSTYGFTPDFGDQNTNWLDEIAQEAYYETMSPDRYPTPATDSAFSRALEWINPFDRDAGLRFGPGPENTEAERIRRLFGTGIRTLPGALGSALQYGALKAADSGDTAAQHIYETYGVMKPEEDTRPLDEKLADSSFLSWLSGLGSKGRAWTEELLEKNPPPPPLDEEALVGEGTLGHWVPKITQSVEDLVQNVPMQAVLKVPAIIGGAVTANPITYSIINSSAESLVEAGEIMDDVLEKGGSYEDALKAADSVFSKNMMLLTPTNILEGGLLLGGGNLTSGLKKMFTSSQLSKMEPLVKTLEGYVKTHPTIATAAKTAGNTLTQVGQEGFEEGMQYAFQRQAQGDNRSMLEILNDPESWRAMRAGGLAGGILGFSGSIRANIQETIAKEDRQRVLDEIKRQEEEAKAKARALKEELDRTDARTIKTEASPFAAKDIKRRAREYVDRERDSILENVEEEYRADTNAAIDRLLEEGDLEDILVAMPEILDEVRAGREGINPGEEIFIPNKNEAGRAVEVEGDSLVYLTTKENGEPVLRRVSIKEAEPLGPGESVEWTDDSGNYRHGIVEKRNLGSVTVRPTDVETTQSIKIPNEFVSARRDAGKRAGMPTSVRGEDAIAVYEQRHPAPKIIKPVTQTPSLVEPEIETPAGISEPVMPVEEPETEQPVPVGALEEQVPEPQAQTASPVPNISQDMKNNPFTTRLFAELVKSRKKILNAAEEGKLDYAFIKDLLYGKGAHKTMRDINEKAANDAVITLASNPDEVLRLMNDTEFINTTLGNTGHFLTGYWGNKARVAPIAYQGIFRKGYKPRRILDVFGGSGYVSNLLNRNLGDKQIPVVLNDTNPETIETHKTVRDKTDAVVNLLKRYESQTKKMWDETHGKKMDLTEAERQFRAKYDSWWKDRRAEAQASSDPVVRTAWNIMRNDGSLAVGDDSQRVANAGKVTKKPFERLAHLAKRVQDAAEQYKSSTYTLTNRDALELLQEAKPGDLVVIDPPYIAAPEMYNRGSDSPWLDETFVERVIKQRIAPLVESGVDVIFHDNASPRLINALEEAGLETRTFPRQTQNTGKDAQFVNEVIGFTTGLRQPTKIPSTSGQRAAAAMPVEKTAQIEGPERPSEKPTGQIPYPEQVRAPEAPSRSSEEKLPVTGLEEGETAPIRTEDVGAVKEKRTGAEWARRYKDVVKLTDTNGWKSVDDFTNTEITKEEFSDRLSRTGHEWTGRQAADETLMPVFVEDVKKINKGESIPPETKRPAVEKVEETKEEIPEIKNIQKPKTLSKEKRGLVTNEENDRYMKAVEENDMETAEKLVEDAARKAEWGILRRYPDGNERDVRVFTHATNRNFRSFDRNAEPATDEGWIGKGFYFHYGKKDTSPYGNRMIHAYLKLDNPYTGSMSKIEDAVIESGVSEENNAEFAQAMQDELIKRGYDGVVTSGEVVVFNPEQIKSADPVAYDEAGNVIPLTERFNPKTSDIYYMRGEAEQKPSPPENVVTLEDLTKDPSRPFYVQDKRTRANIHANTKPTDRQEYLRNGLIFGNHNRDMDLGKTPAGNPILIARKSARASSNDYVNNTTSPDIPGMATVFIGDSGDMVYVFHRFVFNNGEYGIESEYSRAFLGDNGVFRFDELERATAKFFAGEKNAKDFDEIERQAKKTADLMNTMNKRGDMILPSHLEKGELTATDSFDEKTVAAVKEIHKALNMKGATELLVSAKDIASIEGFIKYGGFTWNSGLIEFLANASNAGAAFSPTIDSVNPETGTRMDDPRSATIIMNVDDPASIISNFGHEIGHHLFHIALYEDLLDPKLLNSFIRSYRKYLAEAESSPERSRSIFLENAFTASTLKAAEDLAVEKIESGDYDSLVEYYTNHEGGIHEYFANNVMRWVQTNRKPMTAIERVYADVANRLKQIVAAVKRALRKMGISDRYGVDPTVEDIINAFRMDNINQHYGDGQINDTRVRGIMMVPEPDENGKFNLDVLKKYGLNSAMDTPTPEMQAEDRSKPPDVPADTDELFDVKKSFRYGDEKDKDLRTILQRFRGTVHEQYRLWMDQFDALRRLQTLIEQEDQTYAKDEWAVYDYARVVIGSMENAEQFITRIHHFLRHIDSDQADAFIGYMVAEHATDFIDPSTGEFYPDSPVIYDKNGNKMSPKDALSYVEEHSDEFGDIAQAIRMHYNMAMYRTLVGSGIMTHDTFEKMRLMYPNYVPFFKDIDSKMLEHFIKGDAKKLIQIQKGIQELKGTDVKELLKNPLESMVRNIAVFHTLAARNKVHERLVNISNRKGFEWVASPVERPSQAGRNPVFSMWKNGEKIYFTTDNDIYNALAAFEKHESTAYNAVLTLSEEVNKLFKKGTTRWNPVFMIRNLLKDPFEVSRNSQFWSPPFYHTFKGLVYLIEDAVSVSRGHPGNKYVKAFREGGGFSSGLVERMAPKKIAKDIRSQFHKSPIEQSRSLLNPETWLEFIGNINQFVEMAPKIAEYQMLTESERFKDMPDVRKIRLAREVNIDFARAGLYGKVANKHVAFFNPALQSMDKFVRAFQEGATPKERAKSFARANTKSILYVTLPSILLWLFNHRDPETAKEYAELPADMRDRYWVAKFGDIWLRAPKPFEYGMLYGSLAERWLDDQYADDPDAWRLFAKHAWESVAPPWLPTLLVPWVEAGMNNDMFFDRPIIPDSKKNLPRNQQFGPGTSEVAKMFANSFIGKALDISPYQVDHYVNSYLGGVGHGALSTLDIFAEMLGIRPSGPAKTTAELPFIRGFTIIPYRRSETVSRFYDYYDELEEGHMGARANKTQYEHENLYKLFGRTRRTLSDLWKKKNDIRESEKLAPEKKRVLMDEIDNKAVVIASKALDDYYRIVKKE